MAVYQYRCPNCGIFETTREMGAATPTQPCANCGREARRRYSAPHLSQTPRPLADALDRAEKSSDEPEVVTRVPPRPGVGRPRSPDPRLQGLPKW